MSLGCGKDRASINNSEFKSWIGPLFLGSCESCYSSLQFIDLLLSIDLGLDLGNFNSNSKSISFFSLIQPLLGSIKSSVLLGEYLSKFVASPRESSSWLLS